VAIQISSTNVINDDRSVRVVADTTAARNASPVTGMIRYNTSLSQYEFYNGTVWGPIQQVSAATFSDAYAWGSNGNGRLGDGTTTSSRSPVSVVGGFTDWVQISAGGYHTVAVRANGTAWAWGRGSSGRLGTNTTTDRSSPVLVVGGFTNWVQISTSFGAHTAAIRANGTAWAWGLGSLGRLGTNDITDTSSPVSVVGGFTDWVQISAGISHTAAVRANGTAWAWGANGYGKLGNNTITDTSSPVSVVGGFTDWVQISVAAVHTAAIRANGTAWAWGSNGLGRLGDGTTTSRRSPVSVVGGFTDWVQISAGFDGTAAVRANGTAWAWGNNNSGELGTNDITSRSSPVSVVGGFTDWVQISIGLSHTVAVRANGTVWAWGNNTLGRLGDGTTTSRRSPVSVVGGFTDWVQISAGTTHTAAIRR
jgi:alpha-tubulin suppressor-like RCC1 family protein